MQSKYAFIALIFASLSSWGQPLQKCLTLEFEPSFNKPGTIIISQNAETISVKMIVYKDSNKKRKYSVEQVKAKQNDLTIWSFLETYTFKIKGSTDTIKVEKVFRHGDSILFYAIALGSDGITVKGLFSNGNRNRKFAFWSPSRESPNYLLTKEILFIANSFLKKSKSKNYLKRLESYF